MARDWSLVAVFGIVLLLLPVFVGVAFLVHSTFGGLDPFFVWVGLAAVVFIVLVAAGRRRQNSSDAVWELIPAWQYDGRHVESGGLTRDEQEAALADVEEQAKTRERGSE